MTLLDLPQRQLETERNMGLRLLEALERAELFTGVDAGGLKLKHLSRREKIFLGDTNLMNALVPQPEIGAVRETFFVNQLRASGHRLSVLTNRCLSVPESRSRQARWLKVSAGGLSICHPLGS